MKKALPLLLLMSACDNRPTQWDAFIYPDAQSDGLNRISGFKTFELCQAAAQDQIARLPQPEKASYACGYKCGPHPDHPEVESCKEKRK